MASVPLNWRKVEIRQSLYSTGESVLMQVVVAGEQLAAGGRWGQLDERRIPLWSESYAVLVYAESGFQQRSAPKIVLVFDRADVGGLGVRRGGRLRLKQRQSRVLIVIVVRQEADPHDVAGGQVGLQLSQVVHPPDVVCIGTGRQLLRDVVVVFAVERVDKPHLSLTNRTGHGENGHPLADRDPFDGLQPGSEVRGSNPKVIVAHFC